MIEKPSLFNFVQVIRLSTEVCAPVTDDELVSGLGNIRNAMMAVATGGPRMNDSYQCALNPSHHARVDQIGVA